MFGGDGGGFGGDGKDDQVDGWFCALFTAGMLLCDLDLLARANNLPDSFQLLKPWKDVIFVNLFILGVYLGGVPHVNTDLEILKTSPGWYYLSLLKPQAVFDYKWFYLFWAATFIVSASSHLPWLRRFFELPFNLYLGRISFAFYLVHGPVLWILGDRLYATVSIRHRRRTLLHLQILRRPIAC